MGRTDTSWDGLAFGAERLMDIEAACVAERAVERGGRPSKFGFALGSGSCAAPGCHAIAAINSRAASGNRLQHRSPVVL